MHARGTAVLGNFLYPHGEKKFPTNAGRSRMITGIVTVETRVRGGAGGGTIGWVTVDRGVERANRRRWDSDSGGYQAAHGEQLARAGTGWGTWAVPEAEVGALGEVAGQRVLEIGCGAAHWSAALAARGASCVGLDLSGSQLDAAKRATRDSTVRLVHASASQLPFAAASFDVVFCDHGALSWSDPRLVIAEAARVLRPGGRFAANVSSPWLFACRDEGTDKAGRMLHRPYFGQHEIALAEGGAVYTLGYSDWIRTFRRNGFVIEDLVELRPSLGADTSFTWYVDLDWARNWPAEMVWVASREG